MTYWSRIGRHGKVEGFEARALKNLREHNCLMLSIE